MEWFSYVVAVILFISSIVSPWLVTRENNKQQLKLRKLDLFEISKRKVLENFINCASKNINAMSSHEREEYISSLNTLYVYFDNVPKSVNTLLTCNRNEFSNELTNIVQVLSRQITKE